ncbi:hypothetical protein [Halarcobacter anaerophilus]|uniref:Uncharacterized protein n=1 Tax=Halarcobacter anaerophilus TaxID=877500 RepID=A0A4Q0Y3B6_9BACT|nr:hypothetical protein [Halarcobacter anaerophilus]QDF29116.1 hypothetical protein AANAER_1640 [Halarcobacter anaerophilus]RXJ63744.1 hypothetical protein CRV06_06025 [Halarcobacter anaerophilus]
MNEKLLKEAYKLRFEYFNFFENKELNWHEKYKNHQLYEIVIESFNYDYKQIGEKMPKLLKNFKEE